MMGELALQESLEMADAAASPSQLTSRGTFTTRGSSELAFSCAARSCEESIQLGTSLEREPRTSALMCARREGVCIRQRLSPSRSYRKRVEQISLRSPSGPCPTGSSQL